MSGYIYNILSVIILAGIVLLPEMALAQKKTKPAAKDTTIIYIDSRGNRKVLNPPKPKIIDTVIVLKKGQQTKQLKEPDTFKVVKKEVNKECKCVSMKVIAPDTLGYETYVNYTFQFKNNCKETLWLSSGSFTYLVFNPNGTPAKVLRKLQYTKQYRYPDFVPISPGEQYEYQFADDPFFMYDLHRGWKYKFTFGYYNPKTRRRSGTTFMCNEFRDVMIVVK